MWARRAELIAVASVAFLAILAGPAANGVSHERGRPTSKLVSDYQLTSVSVIPHSTSVWALAAHPTGPTSARFFVLHRVGGRWSQHALPRPRALNLSQIYAPSSHSIWIDGTLGHGIGTPYLLHSTGGAFHRVKVPGVGRGVLNALGGSSAKDIWAVGLTKATTPLTLHYDGRTWSVVPFAGEPANTGMVAVASSGAGNAWAIGEMDYSFDPTPEMFRWKGSSWSMVDIPRHDEALGAVATTSASHAWAVGSNVAKSGRLVSYVISWNGHTWLHQATASPGPAENVLAGVAASSAHRVWAVGYHNQGDFENPIVLHLVGSHWKLVRSPNLGKKAYLMAVGVSSRAVVGAGYYLPGSRVIIISGSDVPSPLVEVPDGSHWAIQPVPRSGREDSPEVLTAQVCAGQPVVHGDRAMQRDVPGSQAESSTDAVAAGSQRGGPDERIRHQGARQDSVESTDDTQSVVVQAGESDGEPRTAHPATAVAESDIDRTDCRGANPSDGQRRQTWSKHRLARHDDLDRDDGTHHLVDRAAVLGLGLGRRDVASTCRDPTNVIARRSRLWDLHGELQPA
jgi:hypothetical protein